MAYAARSATLARPIDGRSAQLGTAMWPEFVVLRQLAFEVDCNGTAAAASPTPAPPKTDGKKMRRRILHCLRDIRFQSSQMLQNSVGVVNFQIDNCSCKF